MRACKPRTSISVGGCACLFQAAEMFLAPEAALRADSVTIRKYESRSIEESGLRVGLHISVEQQYIEALKVIN